jgi:acyl-CoA synthetase (AMP-forming)/AMP-acid ligase II
MGGMPAQAEAYEDLIAQQDGEYQWPVFDENAASSLCYTSGTTGNPKGVLYSHRSTYLHSLLVCQADGLQLSSADSTLLAVPLFHVNAWGVPYASAMCGAKLVLPGPHLDGKNLYELAVEEKCTFSLGVPTVWMGFFKHLESDPSADPSRLSLQRVVIGGAAAPRTIIEKFHGIGVFVIQAWGMSETSPVATIGNLLAQAPRPARRQAGGHPGAAGARHVRRRVARRRRGWVRNPGRQRPVRRPAGARPVGHRRLFPRRGRRRARCKMAGSRPETSPGSTPTATCRSPTAPRT